MDILNIDCLIEIIKYLQLKDQISLHQVNRSLQEAVTELWLIQYKNVQINLIETPLTNREWYRFCMSIRDIAEIMQLRRLTKEKYDIWRTFHYAKVTNFRFSLSKPYFLDDSDVRDLTKILPNLKAFSPHGNLSGLYMDEWPKLKDLNLSYCYKLEMQHFQKIMENLQLEVLKLNIFPNTNQFEQMNLQNSRVEFLKYLELNTYEFYYFLAKPLSNLRELIITNHYNPRQLFDVLLSVWSTAQIQKLETSNVDNILVNCLEMHMNVEELCVLNDENALPENVITSLHLLTNLRKLRFKNCNFRTLDFINFLKTITQLQEISFENCQFKMGKILLRAEDIVLNRTTKLRLNMFENRLIDDNLDDVVEWRRMGEEVTYVAVDVFGSHNLFEMTQLEGATLSYEPLYVVYR